MKIAVSATGQISESVAGQRRCTRRIERTYSGWYRKAVLDRGLMGRPFR